METPLCIPLGHPEALNCAWAAPMGDCHECYANELFVAHVGGLKGLMFQIGLQAPRNTPTEVLSFRRLSVISKESKAKSQPQMEPYINPPPPKAQGVLWKRD